MVPARRTALRVALGLLVATGIVAVLLTVVGVEDVVDSLAAAEPTVLVGVVAAALCWLTAWGLSLYVGLRILDVPTSAPRAVLAFTTVVFANSVMPFAQLGGQPVAALFLSRTTRSEYETSLLATATVDSLNILPAGLFVLIGVGTFARSGPLDGGVGLAVASVVGLSVALPLLAYAAWRNRATAGRYGTRIGSAVGRVLRSVLPSRRLPSPGTIRERVGRFSAGLRRLRANPRLLAVGFALSLLGWVFFVTSFWLSLVAVGHRVPFGVVLLVVPTSMLAVVLPSPGGLGGVEAMLVFLTVSLAGIDPAGALAAALVHRGATHLLPIVIGAGSLGVLGS
jgi:uncharacterized protein (TIRG00374 family)